MSTNTDLLNWISLTETSSAFSIHTNGRVFTQQHRQRATLSWLYRLRTCLCVYGFQVLFCFCIFFYFFLSCCFCCCLYLCFFFVFFIFYFTFLTFEMVQHFLNGFEKFIRNFLRHLNIRNRRFDEDIFSQSE